MLRRRLLATAARSGKDKAAAAAARGGEAEADKDPLGHFRAFRSMDEYVGVTLVQYDNSNERSASDDALAGENDAGRERKPHGE